MARAEDYKFEIKNKTKKKTGRCGVRQKLAYKTSVAHSSILL